MLYTGHISITDKEQRYVRDALINGWDQNAGNYHKKFSLTFAKYTGAFFAHPTSGGTQALTLSLAALGVGAGDEVILPDVTYFACSDVVMLLGAKPVFVDIDPKTWCMTPDGFERAITKRTKAVMPVWLYGNAPDMDKIMQIATQHKIPVVEDACPAVGTFYHNRHAGTFGEFGCFSFHPSKIMTTGFGGMLITNDEELYKRVIYLEDHGEDKTRPYRFWQTGVGYSFPLGNINSALGLAQLERIEELVAKHRQIFNWYEQRISDLGYLNYEQEYCRTNKWMITIVPRYYPEHKQRQDIINQLRVVGIDSRPVFFPISKFPMYKVANTPSAQHFGYQGINLPSGINRTEEEIDFICMQLRILLNA